MKKITSVILLILSLAMIVSAMTVGVSASSVLMMMVPITVFVISQSNIIETMGSSGMKD